MKLRQKNWRTVLLLGSMLMLLVVVLTTQVLQSLLMAWEL